MRDFRLIDATFSMRQATATFVVSRMRAIDELGQANRVKVLHLSRLDFYEAPASRCFRVEPLAHSDVPAARAGARARRRKQVVAVGGGGAGEGGG